MERAGGRPDGRRGMSDLPASGMLFQPRGQRNGHSDVVGGAVIAATDELHQQIDWWSNVLGLTGSPFDSYLTLRGVRTLHTRIRAHQENAQAIVEAVGGHPAVETVHYPGLTDHPGHRIAASQQSGSAPC